jgi:hypothetical protein
MITRTGSAAARINAPLDRELSGPSGALSQDDKAARGQTAGLGRYAPHGLFVALPSVSPLEVLNVGGPTKRGTNVGRRQATSAGNQP